MVSTSFCNQNSTTTNIQTFNTEPEASTQQIKTTPTMPQDNSIGNQNIREIEQQLPTSSKKIMDAATRKSIKIKYNNYIRQWNGFCKRNSVNIDNVTVVDIISFLTELYDNGKSHSVINSTKAALGGIVSFPPYAKISDHPMIIKFSKGLFNSRPPAKKSPERK